MSISLIKYLHDIIKQYVIIFYIITRFREIILSLKIGRVLKQYIITL